MRRVSTPSYGNPANDDTAQRARHQPEGSAESSLRLKGIKFWTDQFL